MIQSDAIEALAVALCKAQAVMEGASKGKVNPAFRSKYADLASVWEACRGPLADNGLAVVQSASAEGAAVTVTTLLVHSSGQWVKDSLTMVAKDASPQAVGSAITYGRRYALAAFVGVSPEDDDGEAAQGRKAEPVAGSVAGSVPVKPTHYDDWLMDLEASASAGSKALGSTFKASKPEFRDYATAHDAAALARCKATAKAADAQVLA